MTNYIIQGQDSSKVFSFADLLNADEEDTTNTQQQTQDTQDVCLISNKPLDGTKIKLECGHSFNYINLYNEVRMNQKGYDAAVNYYETDKVGTTCIKCPYCRKIFNYLLPLPLNIDGVKLQRGVNSPKLYAMKLNCEFTKSEDTKCKYSAYVTPKGSLCTIHYKKVIKMAETKNDNVKINKPKKTRTYKKKSTTEVKITVEELEAPSVPIVSDVEYTEEMLEFEKKTRVKFLKEVLRDHKLWVSGTKKQLVKRIFKNGLTNELFEKGSIYLSESGNESN